MRTARVWAVAGGVACACESGGVGFYEGFRLAPCDACYIYIYISKCADICSLVVVSGL
jgi:hypothetical protein